MVPEEPLPFQAMFMYREQPLRGKGSSLLRLAEGAA
jgi:hypothetical protein